jgi:hypothetical protein
VFATLTADERRRLDTEAATGDELAQVVTDAVLCTPSRLLKNESMTALA